MNLSDEESRGSETDESDAMRLNVVFCTHQTIKTSWLTVTNVVLGTMLNAHILKEKGNFLRIFLVKSVCKLNLEVLAVHDSICEVCIVEFLIMYVSYLVHCLILHSEQLR